MCILILGDLGLCLDLGFEGRGFESKFCFSGVECSFKIRFCLGGGVVVGFTLIS